MSDERINALLARPIVLIGMMGAGKSTIGRCVAELLTIPFIDSDEEIVASSGMSIEEIFERHGELVFRDYERRTIARLLDAGPGVLATGGGAFMEDTTRALIKSQAVAVWLRAPLTVLLKRTRHGCRPLLQGGDRRQILQDLMIKREPIYAEADVTVDTSQETPKVTARRVITALEAHGIETLV